MRLSLIFCILLSLEVFASESNSKSSCQKTFEIQSIYETEKFLDKKYSLRYLKMADKTFSSEQIIHAYPSLDREEEIEIGKHYQEYKDERSYYILFFSKLKSAQIFALNHSKYNRANFDDYFQEATLAISKAIKDYDPSREFALSTYADRNILYAILNFKNREDQELGIKVYRNRALVKKLGEEARAKPEEYGTEAWLEKFQKTYRRDGGRVSKEAILSTMLNFSSQENRLYGKASLQIRDVRSSKDADEIPSDYDKLQDPSNLEKRSVDRVFLQNIWNWLHEELKDRPDKDLLYAIIDEQIFSEKEDRTSTRSLGARFNKSHETIRTKEIKIRKMIEDKFSQKENNNSLKDSKASLKNIPEWLREELKDKPDKDLLFAIIEERIFAEKDKTSLKKLAERFGKPSSSVRYKELKIKNMIRDKFGLKDGERSREI